MAYFVTVEIHFSFSLSLNGFTNFSFKDGSRQVFSTIALSEFGLLPVFVNMLICSHTVYGRFPTTMADLSSSDRNHLALQRHEHLLFGSLKNKFTDLWFILVPFSHYIDSGIKLVFIHLVCMCCLSCILILFKV